MEIQKYKNTRKARLFEIFGCAFLVLSGVGLLNRAHLKEFMFSFLTSSFFWLSIALGSLFFVFLHHLVSAKWSVVVRRFAEQTMKVIPWLGLIIVPVFLYGAKDLFPWADAHKAAHDHLIHKKQAYLNLPFFNVRAVIYFLVWTGLATVVAKLSIKHDETGQNKLMEKMKGLSAGGTLLFALTATFAAFDWIMSLDPHWYSTIFGVYVFAGCLVAVMAFLSIITLYLHGQGYMKNMITEEHYQDLGKLLFAFTCFWAYIAFSQYVLIWYGNIPEETVWYAHRWVGSWKWMSLFLVLGHFIVPFIFLLPRPMKRNRKVLMAFSFWMLFMHLVDLIWLIYPNIYHHGYHFHWYDVTLMLGFGLLFVGRVLSNLSKASIYPINDPLLQESIHSMS
ncbi:MAG TPA: hypothetical protein PKC21_04315 [Oligoflexia bacterium]|nr:hypothetical protein [Oligoflexia bacterium]HMR24563.1 hypothetical protein [Oligoflexia bacterium]